MISTLLALPLVRRIAPVAIFAAAVIAAALGLRSAGERAGRAAAKLEQMEVANDAQKRMLTAAADRARDRGDLADRMRDGRF